MAVLALLPISVGAVVTTVEAGMAFADWPSSDGYNMVTYPWLKSTGDQFLEHGHRLAGMLIGIVSLVFAGWAFLQDRRPIIRWCAAIVLMGVIAQGILGGLRVRMNQDELAMLHGNFAAWVFTAMCVTVIASGNSACAISDRARPSFGLLIGAGIAFVTVFVQYVLGGRLRHLGASDAWLIHPWFAIAVVMSVLMMHVLAGRQNLPWIQTTTQIAVWLVVAQAVLGIFTWGAKFGFPDWEILAVRQSPLQIALSSLHQVVGLLTFAAIGVAFIQVIASLRRSSAEDVLSSTPALEKSLTGGLA